MQERGGIHTVPLLNKYKLFYLQKMTYLKGSADFLKGWKQPTGPAEEGKKEDAAA